MEQSFPDHGRRMKLVREELRQHHLGCGHERFLHSTIFISGSSALLTISLYSSNNDVLAACIIASFSCSEPRELCFRLQYAWSLCLTRESFGGELADLAVYSTLFEVESFITYSGCVYTMDGAAFVTISGVQFQADPLTYTFQEPSPITYLLRREHSDLPVIHIRASGPHDDNVREKSRRPSYSARSDMDLSTRIVEVLLGTGADCMSVDNEGRMVLHYAVVQRYSQVIPMLLLAGADVLRRDNHFGEKRFTLSQKGTQKSWSW